MSSGRALLSDLDRALSSSRDEFRALDLELQSASASLARNRRREVGVYQKLARLRLADIAASDFVAAVDEADARAASLLEDRERELAALEASIADSQQRLKTLEAQRSDAVSALGQAELALDELLRQVDEDLTEDDEYREQTEAVENALEVAANAQAKTAEAQARREEKRQPYEQDSLFMYLWSAGYGTSAYKAGLITRLFDRMVARHIRYEPARRNYHTLNEIPRRLASHTQRVEEKAAALAAALSEYEREADIKAGCEALETNVASALATLNTADAAVEGAQDEFDAQLAAREQYSSATDPLFKQAMQVLDEQFRAEPVPQLRREAALTSNVRDDALIDELAAIRDEEQRLSLYLADHRDLHSRRANRVNELSAIRQRFRARKYDAENSRIDGAGKVDMMLSEFLRGLVSSDQLWKTIRHAQRFRQSRTSQRRSGVDLGGIKIPRMPRSVRLPRSGGFGGGGFGGGGGGFRTKGGF